MGYTYSKSIDQASNLGEQTNPFNASLTRVISSWDMTHNFVATYTTPCLSIACFTATGLRKAGASAGPRASARGFPVTLFDDSDRSLLGTLGNGVNNQLLDTPRVSGGPLKINTNPRNGQTGIQYQPVLGRDAWAVGQCGAPFLSRTGHRELRRANQQECAADGIEDRFDIRVEAFNVFNHAQFYGPASVDGEVNDANFGSVVSAAAPRLVQLAVKFHF